MLAEYVKKLFSLPGEEQRIYSIHLLYSLSHKITLYCTALFVESLIFSLCNQQKWRSDVNSLAKSMICCLVKHDDISNGVAMDECEVMVK